MRPDEEERRDHQTAQRIADPPHGPERGRGAQRMQSSSHEEGHSDGRAYARRQHNGGDERHDGTPSRSGARDTSKRVRARMAAPATASRVLPAPIPAATHRGSPAAAFAPNAPRRMPGTARRPKSTTAASANPVGGQTADTSAARTASASPSFADAMYSSATPRV